MCLPVHSFELIEVDDNFFVHYGKQEEINKNNKGDIANLGFIVGDKSVAVIDAGSTLEISTQLINSIKKVETNIRKIFDNQTSKQFKIFPGTDITILKNEKSINAKEIYSLSSYNISKKNNLNINKI